jgi:S1-C subfamily serine protease
MNTRNAKLIAGAIACGIIGAAVNSVYVADTAHARGASQATASSVAYAAGEDDQQRIVDAVRHTEPSVVALEVSQNGNMVVPNDPFAQFFGNGFGGMSGGDRLVPYNQRSSGSGFVYSPSGLIVTNDHVVHGASAITVIFANGDHVPGHIYSENRGADVALVKVDGYKKLPPALQFANSRDVQQGQWAIAVGEPFELKETVTVGVVSGFHRDESIADNGQPVEFHNLLQTSAPINPGNSGGPLVDLDGRVIGINQSVESSAQGIGFAIPSDAASTAVGMLERNPGATRSLASGGFIGVQLQALDTSTENTLGYKGQGVVVQGVIGGSPADTAGLQPGDVIQSVDGKPVTAPSDVSRIVRALSPGKYAAVDIWRGGMKSLVSVQVEARPESEG